jgi:hypothetical protein
VNIQTVTIFVVEVTSKSTYDVTITTMKENAEMHTLQEFNEVNIDTLLKIISSYSHEFRTVVTYV